MAISESDRHDAYQRDIQVPVLNVQGIVAMLRRRTALIAIVTLACGAICLGWTLLSAPKYVASGRMLLDLPTTQADGHEKSSVAAGNAEAIGVRDQIHIMTSRSVYDRVIARENLETDPLFGGKSRGILSALLAGVGLSQAIEPHAMVLRQLERAVMVVRSPGSDVVDVNVVTSDRDTSARIANAVMDAYIQKQEFVREGAPSGHVESSARLETLRSRLQNAEQRLEAFRVENQLPNVDGQSKTEKHVSDLSAQIGSAEAKTSSLSARLGQLQRARRVLEGGGIPDMARNGAFGGVGYRYAVVKQLELDLSETLGPRHPDLVIAKLRAVDAKRSLDQSIQASIQSASSELEQTRASVIRLKNRLEASRKSVTISNEAASHFKELATDVEASRAAYQAVLARSREPSGQSPSIGSNSRILTRAAAPAEPSRSFPIGVLFASLLIGLGLGVSLAWLRELMDAPERPVIAP